MQLYLYNKRQNVEGLTRYLKEVLLMFRMEKKWLSVLVCLCMLWACGLGLAEDAAPGVAQGTIWIDGSAYDAAASGEGWTLETAEDGFALTLSGYQGGAISSGGSLTVALEGENTINASGDYGLGAAGDLVIAGEGRLTVNVTSPAENGWISGLWSAQDITLASDVDIHAEGGCYAVGIKLDDGMEAVDTSSSLLTKDGANITIHARPMGLSSAETAVAEGILFGDSGEHLLAIEAGAKVDITADATLEGEDTLTYGIRGRNAEMLISGDLSIQADAGISAYGIQAMSGGMVMAPGSHVAVDAQAQHGIGMMIMDKVYCYGDASIQGSTAAFHNTDRVTYPEGARLTPGVQEELTDETKTVVIQGGMGGSASTGGGAPFGPLAGGGPAMLAIMALALVLAMAWLLESGGMRLRAASLRAISCALLVAMAAGLCAMPVAALAEAIDPTTEGDMDVPMSYEVIVTEDVPEIDPEYLQAFIDADVGSLLASFDEGNGDMPGNPLAIVNVIGGKIVDKAMDKAIDWALGDLFDNIFGGDESHKEIMDTLHNIERKLDQINETLKEIVKKIDELIDSVKDNKIKIELGTLKTQIGRHRERYFDLKAAVTITRGIIKENRSKDAKFNALENFYKKAPQGSRSMLEYVMSYVDKMTDTAFGPDIYAAYDRFVELSNIGFETEGYPFRETMRLVDACLVMEALSMLSLYQRAMMQKGKDNPISQTEIDAVKDTTKQMVAYLDSRQIKEMPVGFNRFTIPYKFDVTLYGFKQVGGGDIQDATLDQKTWKNVFYDADGTGRALNLNELKMMYAGKGWNPESNDDFHKFINQGRFADGDTWPDRLLTVEGYEVRRYSNWSNWYNIHCWTLAADMFYHGFNLEMIGSFKVVKDKVEERRLYLTVHTLMAVDPKIKMETIALEGGEALSVAGEITDVSGGRLTILPDGDGAQAMDFIVDTLQTTIQGEMTKGAHATVSYMDVGDSDEPGGAETVLHYAMAVECDAYGPSFEVAGLVTMVAGNAVTLIDANGREHGFLLTDTQIEGDLREGVYAVATCHKEVVQDTDTIIVDKLVCSGVVDKPVTVRGSIEAMAEGSVTISVPQGEDIVGMTRDGASQVLRLTDTTAINGALALGRDVTATYHTEGGEKIADAIDVVMPPAPTPQTVTGQLSSMEQLPGGGPAILVTLPSGAMAFLVPGGLPDGLTVGATVQVTYHEDSGTNIADGIDVIDTPAPAPDPAPVGQTIDGKVTALDISEGILGMPPRMTLSTLGNLMELRVIGGLPEEIDIGATVHVHYYDEDGAHMADSVTVLQPPMPGPIDPDDPLGPVPNPNPDDPFNPVPNPNPDDPFNPVPAPQSYWVEGYITQLALENLMPGQPRSMVVSAAGQDFALTVPMEMWLAGDVQAGAFVHADYHTDASGQNVIDTLVVLTPAPAPDPMPGPINRDDPVDPMPGPLDDPFVPVVLP